MTNMPPSVDIPKLVTLTKPLLADYLFIAHHLPEDQQRQASALSDGSPYDPERFALAMACRVGPKWALVQQDGTPVAIGGYDMIRPGVWQDYLIGTVDGWKHYWRSITKHCNQVMAFMLKEEAWRLQCVALADRTMAHKWFKAVGLEYEGTLRNYGAAGEDCFMFSRVRADHGR